MIPFFAAPWFLLGFLSLSIPILLLLTKAKTSRTESFSSVFFLRTITEKAIRTIEWKKILLLLLRLAFLLCLALAFALPFFKKTGGGFLFGSSKHLIYILDDSYSMSYKEDGKTLFKQAKKIIAQTIDKEKDLKARVSLYLFHDALKPVVLRTRDRQLFFEKLTNAETSQYKSDFSSLRLQLEELIANENGEELKVFLISDYSINDRLINEGFPYSVVPDDTEADIKLIPIQPKSYQNFVVKDIRFPPSPFIPREKSEIQVTYQAFNQTHGSNVLSLWVGQERVEDVKIDLRSEEEGIATFSHVFSKEGQIPIRVSSRSDELEIDNDRYAIGVVRAPLRLLLVEGQEYRYPFDNPYFYFANVLQSYGEGTGKRSWVDLVRISRDSLSAVNLSEYDAVIAADIPSFSPKQVSTLSYYVKQGGVLIFAPGKSVSVKDYNKNRYLQKLLGGYFGPVMTGQNEKSVFNISEIPYSHPIFNVFEGGLKGDLTQVQIDQMMPFTPTEDEGSYDVVLWFESKWPGLIERKFGLGRVFVWSSTLNTDWTDFPRNPLYVPFVFELLKYATLKEGAYSHSLEVGDPLTFNYEEVQQAVLTDPKNNKTTFYLDEKITSTLITIDQSGFYQYLQRKGANVKQSYLAANVGVSESEPAYVDPIRFQRVASQLSNKVVDSDSKSAFTKRIYIYRSFLWAALILLLLELLVANRVYSTKWV